MAPPNSKQVLIIDDDHAVNDTLRRVVERQGAAVVSCFSVSEGRQIIRQQAFDAVFLDMQFPDGTGIDLLPDLKSAEGHPEIVIITAYSDFDSAEVAIQHGVWDYIQKPMSVQDITLILKRLFEYRDAKQTTNPLSLLKRSAIIGSSTALTTAMNRLAQAASGSMNVLITGETGTGKELFARALHDNSSRADNPFVVLDCTVLPDTLIESILFGHIKGAFTGAMANRTGLVSQADGGTLFMDEIGELPLNMQKKLLRVLQERRYRPVGSQEEHTSDFRLVAATNRNLDQMVEKSDFREDLLYRLRSFELALPPLRERVDDIQPLVSHYTTRFCNLHTIDVKGFSPEFIDSLKRYDWPGNVRELLNTLEQALVTGLRDPILYPTHLPSRIRVKLTQASFTSQTENNHDSAPDTLTPHGPLPSYKEYQQTMEERYLRQLINVADGNISEAARLSGFSRKHIYTLLRKHNISS